MLYVAEPFLGYRRGGTRTRPIQHITERLIQKNAAMLQRFFIPFFFKKSLSKKTLFSEEYGF
ncbi:hypothetical protein D1814_12875 [Alteromonas sp. BL110]|nr:hypothetical protein D1814_12875 [Alteromonas sp. BL110]RKM82005.1 hypothetical protein D7031_06675 [Alteromonas sp. BL110]